MSRSYWLLCTMCMVWAGCTGDDYEPPPAVVIVDDEDMPGGVDSGVVIGGPGGMMNPGGMMGQEVDPLFLRWIEGRVKLAQYDCTCSQGEAWSPVWNKEACAEGWTRYIGGEQTLNCQYNKLFGDVGNKARFSQYVGCFEGVDNLFNQCIDMSQCTSDKSVVEKCLKDWNVARNLCIFQNVDVHNVMEECRAPVDGVNAELLTYNYWETAFSSAPKIISPILLDWPLFERFSDKCTSSYRCTVIQMIFRGNGLYSSYTLEATVGNLNAPVDRYAESGTWGVEGGRIFFSPDCKSVALQRSGALLFQRIFFGNVALNRIDTPNSKAFDLQGDISQDYACENEAMP